MDRIVARRALIAAAAVGVVAQALLVYLAVGVNLVVLTAIVLVAAALLARMTDARIDPADAWIPVTAIVVAAGTAIRSDETLVFLDAVAAAVLLGASVAAFAGAALTRRSAVAIVALGTFVLAWSIGGIARLAEIASRSGPDGPRRSLPAPARAIARGLLIALPVLLVFGLLFASADAIFAALAQTLFDWRVDLADLPIRAGVAFAVAWIVAGLFSVATGLADTRLSAPDHPDATGPGGAPAMQSLGAAVATAGPASAGLPRIGVVEAVTVLVAVDALFGLFVGLQVAYLFGGLDTMAAGGITYANYARRGFFELVAVTCLSGCLVVGLNAAVAERTRTIVVAAVGLAVLTAIVLASAALRLSLYQDAYGWTELRFYVAATIAWLGIGIAAAIALLATDRMRWLAHAMTIGAVVVLVGVNVIGPQRLVAEANVARLLDPGLVPPDGRKGLDLDYALTLGDDAVPALVAALPALGPDDRRTLRASLEARWLEEGRTEFAGWPAWNLARQRADTALAALFAPGQSPAPAP
jgi:Domain of unknown function (DUF4173)